MWLRSASGACQSVTACLSLLQTHLCAQVGNENAAFSCSFWNPGFIHLFYKRVYSLASASCLLKPRTILESANVPPYPTLSTPLNLID